MTKAEKAVMTLWRDGRRIESETLRDAAEHHFSQPELQAKSAEEVNGLWCEAIINTQGGKSGRK